MMTAPSLLSSDVNHADGAPPAQSILHSAPDDSRRGDFQEFMGLAQAGQNATGSSSPSAPVLPPPSDPSDKSTPSAPSTPPQPTLDNSIAGLVLAMFAQPPKEEIRPPQPGASLHSVPSADAAMPESGVVGRAVPCPPHDAGATLLSSLMPDAGQRTAHPAPPGPTSTDALPGAKPVQSAIRNPQSAITDPSPGPAKIAGLNDPPPTSPPAPETTPPGAELAAANSVAPPLAPPVPQSGTPAAINGQHMKSALQKNEIAGSAAQKLPPDRTSAPARAGADEAIPGAKTRLPADFSDPKEFAAQWMVLDTSAKGDAPSTLTTNVQAASAPSSGPVAQVERMISREVLMVRQSGAQALAVSLKVDSQTSLFLQLTNHHGQIEVSVRCEKGDAGALDAHWGQLQESLARQNVQLLPLQDKPFSSRPSFDVPAETPNNFQDGPPAQHPPPSPPSPKTEKPTDDAMNAAVGVTKSKAKPRHYHGWEKWA